MSSTEKKKSPNPSLPNDLLLSCIARVSTLHYPTLSLVSKTFRSLLTSPELYETRSLLNRNETCLYVCLKFSSNTNPRWLTLCQKPNQTLTIKKKKKKKSSGYVLAPVPIQTSPQALIWEEGVVSVGSDIYAIGGPINEAPSSSVSILDCKSYTWCEAPKMKMERSYATSNVVDGKIYVAGGCKDYNSSNWIEVFDTKTQTWELLLNPLIERCKIVHMSAVIEGKIYMFEHKGVVYNAKEDKWEALGESYFDLGWVGMSDCVIDNVLYCYCILHGLRWYDSKIGDWKNLKGLKGLPKFASYGLVRLVDYGGKMAILWVKYLPSSGYKSKVIWCAVIALERCDSEEIWGNVEWLDAVLTVPTSYDFCCAVAATV